MQMSVFERIYLDTADKNVSLAIHLVIVDYWCSAVLGISLPSNWSLNLH